MITKTYEETEALIGTSRRKIQALLNYGFEIVANGELYDKANTIANMLENGDTFTLTIPAETCTCLKVSDMAFKLLKPYLKDLLHIEQKATKTHFLLFAETDEVIGQFAEDSESVQITKVFELPFNKHTMPTYTNKSKLYSIEFPPTLTPKALKKIKSLYDKVIQSEGTYFLLSDNLSYSYNAPMTILRKLGENVISLKALNVLELLLIFATNSSALFRQPNDGILPFVISSDYFKLEDFELNQSEDEICKSLNELKVIGLINSYELIDSTFEITSNVIVKSIKQYSYKQDLHYYRNLDLHQQGYVYTFINYLQYVKNIRNKKETKDLTGREIQITEKAETLTISLEGLIYNLELGDYLHDLTHLTTILQVLQTTGIQQGLLTRPNRPLGIEKEDVKYLLTHRDKLHEYFVLNPNDPVKIKAENNNRTIYYTDPKTGRQMFRR